MPNSKSELIQLAFILESTSAYRGHGFGTNAILDNVGGGKGGKKARSEVDIHASGGSGPTTSRIQKDEPIIDVRPARDLSRVKCYNYRQFGHVFSTYTIPPEDPGMPSSGKA